MTTYFIAYSVNNGITTVHLVDDIDCMPPDVYGPISRAADKFGAWCVMRGKQITLRRNSFSGKRVRVCANVTEGCFETVKAIREWSKA